MPALDAGRGRLHLLPEDLPLLAALLAGEPDAAEHPRVPVLEEAGLLQDARPVRAVAEALAVVATAGLVVDVETVSAVPAHDPPQLLLTHSVHVSTAAALTTEACVGSAEVQLVPVLPAALPWELARLVGLTSRPAPPGTGTGPVAVPTVALEGVSAVVATLPHPEQARADVTALLTAALPGTDAATVEAVAALVCARRGTWRVTARWCGPVDPTRWSAQVLEVLDGGEAGWWQRTPGPEGTTGLEPLGDAELWRRLCAVVQRP